MSLFAALVTRTLSAFARESGPDEELTKWKQQEKRGAKDLIFHYNAWLLPSNCFLIVVYSFTTVIMCMDALEKYAPMTRTGGYTHQRRGIYFKEISYALMRWWLRQWFSERLSRLTEYQLKATWHCPEWAMLAHLAYAKYVSLAGFPAARPLPQFSYSMLQNGWRRAPGAKKRPVPTKISVVSVYIRRLIYRIY